MKKKFLLAIIPALLALSSCAAGASKTKNDIFLEDTLAHEEIFGDVEEVGYVKTLTPLKDPDPVNPLEEPTIGVQYQPRYEKVADSGEWYYSIRFVAAITSLSVDAQWTRGVSNTNSEQLKPVGTNATLIATTAYERVNDNGVITTASSVALKRDAEPDTYPYHYFVVYTLRDIPETYADCFAVAYLTITDGVNTTVSKAVAARIAGGHEFSFAANKSGGYFMAGTIGGSPNTILDLGAGSGDNKAQKLDQRLNANDLFGYYLIANANAGYLSSFQYYGWSTFKNEVYYLERDAGSELFKVRVGGTYDIYVNKDFQFYMGCDSVDNMTLYFKPDATWLGGSSKSAVYYTDNSSFNGLVIEDSENHIYKIEGYNFKTHPVIIFTKHNPAIAGYSWYGEGENCWDQTVNITYTDAGNPTKNLYTITGGDYKSRSGTWSIYNPSGD